MNAPIRSFQANDAAREHVPLLIGLTGPSGGGKTYSALRLATGIQSVTGGDIYFIDTESRRALHYADTFNFKHVPFNAPFGSLDYLEALKFCVSQGAKVIVVDSMSHEHEGPGGMVDMHDTILQRMAGDDFKKRNAMTMLAWSEPKGKRRQLINGILQLNCNFIFCFRAKNVSKPVKVNGKTEVQQMGYMPIAGEEFVFEQTLNALLLPGAGGVPTWFPEEQGERTMVKLPEQFKRLSNRNAPLDEKVGRHLALWARGEAPDMPETGRADEEHGDQFDGTESPQSPSPEDSPPVDEGAEAVSGREGGAERQEGAAPSNYTPPPLFEQLTDRLDMADDMKAVDDVQDEFDAREGEVPLADRPALQTAINAAKERITQEGN
jgi:AAA domain